MAPGSVLLLVAMAVSAPLALAGGKGVGAKGAGGGGSGGAYVPMALTEEDYFFRTEAGGSDCLGEDDELSWRAEGSLGPGESFSFTPRVPACDAHSAAVSVLVSGTGGSLVVSTEVPDPDHSSWDLEQKGKPIVAAARNGKAQLCMFPSYRGSGRNYTIKVTNTGTETAAGVVIDGRSENDWTIYYYPRCLNADADGDGWNDALEHTMGILTAPNAYIDGEYQQFILWGSNYLRHAARTAEPEDEVDSYPPDFNDDGVVDALDLSIIGEQTGQGNGIPLERISPNPSDAEYHYKNALPWRRYDLDGDGRVDHTDVGIVAALVGQPVPPTEDVLAPTARLVDPPPGASVPRGQYVRLRAHAWDNAALTQVDYLVDGRTVCSQTEPVASFGFESPLLSCWWEVPRKTGPYGITVRAYDAAGHVVTSAPVQLIAE